MCVIYPRVSACRQHMSNYPLWTQFTPVKVPKWIERKEHLPQQQLLREGSPNCSSPLSYALLSFWQLKGSRNSRSWGHTGAASSAICKWRTAWSICSYVGLHNYLSRGSGDPSKKESTMRRWTYLENTLVALGAVMCSLGLPPHAALLATVQSSCVDIVRHLDICRNVARICECASQVRKYRHQTQAIENYELKQTVKR